jgi:hypothetical protein
MWFGVVFDVFRLMGLLWACLVCKEQCLFLARGGGLFKAFCLLPLLSHRHACQLLHCAPAHIVRHTVFCHALMLAGTGSHAELVQCALMNHPVLFAAPERRPKFYCETAVYGFNLTLLLPASCCLLSPRRHRQPR